MPRPAAMMPNTFNETLTICRARLRLGILLIDSIDPTGCAPGLDCLLIDTSYCCAALANMLEICDSISPVVAQRMYSPLKATGRAIASTVVTTLVFAESTGASWVITDKFTS